MSFVSIACMHDSSEISALRYSSQVVSAISTGPDIPFESSVCMRVLLGGSRVMCNVKKALFRCGGTYSRKKRNVDRHRHLFVVFPVSSIQPMRWRSFVLRTISTPLRQVDIICVPVDIQQTPYPHRFFILREMHALWSRIMSTKGAEFKSPRQYSSYFYPAF